MDWHHRVVKINGELRKKDTEIIVKPQENGLREREREKGPMDWPYPRRSYKDHDEEKKWVEKINEELRKPQENGMSLMTPSIFMAPAPLRGLKQQAFIPQVVPIGPYHCDVGPHHSSFPANHESQRYIDIAAREMESHKIMTFKYVAKNFKEGHSICSLASKFESKVREIKQEYGSQLACSQNHKRLALMLALDASFVVEVLKCNAEDANIGNAKQSLSASTSYKQYWQACWKRSTSGLQNGIMRQGEDEAMRQENVMQSTLSDTDRCFNPYYCSGFPLPLRKSILQDFVLLENQIPLFCLLEVVQMEESCKPGTPTEAGKILGPLVVQMASEVLPFNVNMSYKTELVERMSKNLGSRKHLLDCLYAILTFDPSTKEDPKEYPKEDLDFDPTHFPRAVELHNSGISFEQQRDSTNLMHVHFDPKTAKLHMPKVRVGDDTERLFRNLIAYESHKINNVTVLSYLRFMNNLVNDEDDVALLIQKGIITEDIGSDLEVAHMWNNLCVNTVRVCSKSYENTAQQMREHCNRRVNRWKAEVKRTYIDKPWLFLSLVSGFSLLLMTLIILIYTILLYLKPEPGAMEILP